MKPNYLTDKIVANANIKKKKEKRKKEKGKGKNFYRNEMLTVYFLWPYLIRSSTTFFFNFVCSLSDVDECSEAHPFKMNKCHPHASCTNTQGSYNCSSDPAFIGDGFDCTG